MAIKMKTIGMIALTLISILCLWLACPDAFAASASSALLKAKKEAESKGYIFFTSRDEIISRARREGKLHVQSGLGESTRQATTPAFRKRYPFIDPQLDPLEGPGVAERVLREVQAGVATWDIVRTATYLYGEYAPLLWKVDLSGMAEHGVLDIPPHMIDPKNRNAIALGARFFVIPYNTNLVSPGQVPKSFEDMLKPEFKGRKFGAEIVSQELASLVPEWGLEKTLDYARKIAAQQPIWYRGGGRALAALAAGEIPIAFLVAYSTTKRAQHRDPLGVIQYTILEPVPARIVWEHGIPSASRNPHAALLWLEFIAGAEAQKLIDQHEPLVASIYRKGTVTEQMIRGKKVSLVSWEYNIKTDEHVNKIVEAFGFPRVEAK